MNTDTLWTLPRTRLGAIVARGQYRAPAPTLEAEPSVTESLIVNFVRGLLAREYLDNHLEQGAAAGLFSATYARAAAATADLLASLFHNRR